MPKNGRHSIRPVRIRDAGHVRAVALLPCCVPGCKQTGFSHAHHLETTPEPMVQGVMPSDIFVVPLCRHHKMVVEEMGDSPFWKLLVGLDPLPLSQSLYARRQEEINRGRSR